VAVTLPEKAACSLSPFNKFAYSTRERREYLFDGRRGTWLLSKASQSEITREEITRSIKVRWLILKHFKEDIIVLHKTWRALRRGSE
jgi:hypothetical protein